MKAGRRTPRADIDSVAVEIAVSGSRVVTEQLSTLEFHIVIAMLDRKHRSADEIARQLGITERTVTRARQRIRDRYEHPAPSANLMPGYRPVPDAIQAEWDAYMKANTRARIEYRMSA